jgi:hypothetical protein
MNKETRAQTNYNECWNTKGGKCVRGQKERSEEREGK